MAETTPAEQCCSMVRSPYMLLMEACAPAEDAADASPLLGLSDAEYDVASQVGVVRLDSKTPKVSKEAQLDLLKTMATLAVKKNAALTKDLEELENTLFEDGKELKALERKYEEELAIDKAMDSLLLQLPKNNILVRGKKLQQIANKLSSAEMPQCESSLKHLNKSVDSYITKLVLQNESSEAAIAEKRKKLHQLSCAIRADEDYQRLATGNIAKLEELIETLDVRHKEQMEERQKQLKSLNKELSEVERLSNEAEITCKALSCARHIE